MKISPFLCISAVLAATTFVRAESIPSPASPFAQALREESSELTIRGQSPGPILLPPDGSTTVYQQPSLAPGSVLMDSNVGAGMPYNQAYPSPVPYDPWSVGGASGVYPNGVTPGPFGLNGPQPYRFNSWTERLDAFYMASTGTSSPNLGSFGMSGVDFNKDCPIPLPGNWVLTPSMDYGGRFLQGPNGALTNSHLPGNMHRFGLGLKIASPLTYGWGFEAAVEPWLATDFGRAPTSKAFLFDGHLAALWQVSPQTMWIFGVSYWDRVDKIILPYGGLVWTPNDYWEFRLIFPKPRITAFIGAPLGVPTWLYASGEYHVEAYEVNTLAGANSNALVQFSDIRAMGGIRWETPRVTTFLEAGYIFDRKVKFDRSGGNFSINSGFMTHVGLRF